MPRSQTKRDEVIITLYREGSRTVDDLPYTSEFEVMHSKYLTKTGVPLNHHDLWLRLAYLRKRGLLPHKGREN